MNVYLFKNEYKTIDLTKKNTHNSIKLQVETEDLKINH